MTTGFPDPSQNLTLPRSRGITTEKNHHNKMMSSISPKKRKRDTVEITCSSSCSENRQESKQARTNRHHQNVPPDISEWGVDHLTKLSIVCSYQPQTTPLQLLNMFPPEYHSFRSESLRILSNYILPFLIDDIELFINEYCDFTLRLDDDIHSMSSTSANILRHRKSLYESEQFLSRIKCPTKKQNMTGWLRRFETCGLHFGQKLYCIIKKRELQEREDCTFHVDPLSEHNFQFLFDAFVSMFGLKSFDWFDPLIPWKILHLDEAEVRGKPSILYCQDFDCDSCDDMEKAMQVVAVCEVKKCHVEADTLDCGARSGDKGSDMEDCGARSGDRCTDMKDCGARSGDRGTDMEDCGARSGDRGADKEDCGARSGDKGTNMEDCGARSGDRGADKEDCGGRSGDRGTNMEDCAARARDSSTSSDHAISILPPHLPASLLGQHGGNLLLYYNQSVQKGVIFGLIVQETKVTFTALQMTKEQYENLIAGKLNQTPVRLIMTRAYDFMMKEDRKHLIRPLLELAMMQENIKTAEMQVAKTKLTEFCVECTIGQWLDDLQERINFPNYNAALFSTASEAAVTSGKKCLRRPMQDQ